MTPFCSLKQNCNTLLVQSCYSKQLKAVKKWLWGQAEIPMGSHLGLCEWSPRLGAKAPIWTPPCTSTSQSVINLSSLPPLSCLSEHCANPIHIPSNGPLDACLCFFPFGYRTCIFQFPSMHKMLLGTLTIQASCLDITADKNPTVHSTMT